MNIIHRTQPEKIEEFLRGDDSGYGLRARRARVSYYKPASTRNPDDYIGVFVGSVLLRKDGQTVVGMKPRGRKWHTVCRLADVVSIVSPEEVK